MGFFQRIQNKTKSFATSRRARALLKKLHAEGGEKMCLAEHAQVMAVTQGLFAARIGKSVTFWPDAKISLCAPEGKNACLVLGDGVSIGNRTQIHVGNYVEIGEGSLISWDCVIMDRDYHAINSDTEILSPVLIGKHVLVGARSIILKGVKIGDGAIVGAGSVVNNDVPSNCLVAGNPAKVVKGNVEWH